MKKKRKRSRPLRANDVHHILWTKQNWDHGQAKALRNFWYCKISIPRDTLHRHIHEEISKIPVPNEAICREALEQLKMLERHNAIKESDNISRRIKIISACLDTGDSPTVEALRRQLQAVQSFEPG